MSEMNGINKDIEWIRESLERIETRLECMEKDCRNRHHVIDLDLAALGVRAGLYGALAGVAPAIVAVVALLMGGR